MINSILVVVESCVLERTGVILGTAMARAIARWKKAILLSRQRGDISHTAKEQRLYLHSPRRTVTIGWSTEVCMWGVCPETETAVKILAGL